MKYKKQPREELYERLHKYLQPYITWLSGIPSGFEKYNLKLNSFAVIALAVLSISIGFLFIYSAISVAGLYGGLSYFIGFCFVSGGMRRLDVLIIHQSLHNKVFSSIKWNKYIGEFLTIMLIRTPYENNKKGHLGHHRSPCDESDEDIIFLKEAGIYLQKSRAKLYIKILLTVFSPFFHFRFIWYRLSANLFSDTSKLRKLFFVFYLSSLITISVTFGYELNILLYWIVPLIFGFQISNFLYTLTEHRWWLFKNEKARSRENKDQLSFARVCCSIPPKNGNWVLWWCEAIFIHTPVRLFIVVGDTVQHDLHHVAPGCDWPNSMIERAYHFNKTPERFTEVWGGFFAHVEEANLEKGVTCLKVVQ